MGLRVTCRERTDDRLVIELWMRGNAATPPLHVHPRQTERIEVLEGTVRSRSGATTQILRAGDTVDRAGRLTKTGLGNPVRLAATGQSEAEFFLARVPVGVQRASLKALARLAR